MFRKILIANRGEIACRVMRTAKRLGIACAAVYSEADRDALHVSMAEEAYGIGPAEASESYLNIAAIICAAKRAGAEAIHPGYGFLSENASFAEACEAAGIVFIGPPAGAMRAMGRKDVAKRLMAKAGVPVIPGYHGEDQGDARLLREANRLGYPAIIKARAGGGGRGVRRVGAPEEFLPALASARREALSNFADGAVLVEKYLVKPRHIEVQVFADHHGNAVHLFERDCSLQRRHQKVVEEAPAPGMTPELREAMCQAAVAAARAVDYRGAGTVEFIADASEGLKAGRFYFMEMNTRLQVEHPVTEAITGRDLVEWQLRVAAGERLPARQDEIAIRGHAFEARIYAEDAEHSFMPATGRLLHLHLAQEEARVDTGVRQGDTITPFYDPMIAKVIAHAPDRQAALDKLVRALEDSRAVGCATNLAFLIALCRNPKVISGNVDTGLIEEELATLTSKAAPPPEAIAAAALGALGLLLPPKRGDPWERLRGWRLWTEAKHSILLGGIEGPIPVGVVIRTSADYAVETPAACLAVRVRLASAERAALEIDGRTVDAAVIPDRNEISVFLRGQVYRFRLPDPLAPSGEQTDAEDRLRAPVPGVVKSVRGPGSRVAKGDVLIVVEAMKMEFTLAAPRDGEIGEVFAEAGARVEEGAVLLVMAEDRDG